MLSLVAARAVAPFSPATGVLLRHGGARAWLQRFLRGRAGLSISAHARTMMDRERPSIGEW